MSTFPTTTPEAIREGLANELRQVVPRHATSRASRWTWQRDQEIAGTLRNFDVLLQAEDEVPAGWYGGGIEMACATEIRVSYPLSEDDATRLFGADGQDLASVLAQLHTKIAGMFPVSVEGRLPITNKMLEGETGSYIGRFFTRLHFFASDTYATE